MLLSSLVLKHGFMRPPTRPNARNRRRGIITRSDQTITFEGLGGVGSSSTSCSPRKPQEARTQPLAYSESQLLQYPYRPSVSPVTLQR